MDPLTINTNEVVSNIAQGIAIPGFYLLFDASFCFLAEVLLEWRLHFVDPENHLNMWNASNVENLCSAGDLAWKGKEICNK